MSEWIKCSERLPGDKDYANNLVLYENMLMCIVAYYDDNRDSWYSTETATNVENVTHWMPLPSPPEDK